MNSEFIENFKKLKLMGECTLYSREKKRKHDLAVIDFLQAALRGNELEGTEEIGFAYWNISDSFARISRQNICSGLSAMPRSDLLMNSAALQTFGGTATKVL